MRIKILKDLKVYSQYANPLLVIFFSKGFHAMVAYRLGFLLAKTKILTPISFLLSRIIQVLYGIDIHWGAKIGSGCRIVHGYGLVISDQAVIGENCSLYHGVTIGIKSEWSGEKPPVLGKNVTVYAGAKIIGAVSIADNIRIGANTVVTKNLVNSGGTYVGIPAKLIKKK